jgi:hypothetical protein
MIDILEWANIGPNDDARSWALRLVHYGLIVGSVSFVLLIVIAVATALLTIYIIGLRREVIRLSKQVQILLERGR